MKKVFSIFVAIAMLLSSMSFTAFAQTGNWIDSADTSWYNDTDAVFVLNSAEQLAGLASLVNGGNTLKDKTIELGADIDLSGKDWTPIGLTGDTAGFQGTFEGNNKVISNLTVTLTDGQYHSAGLFGSARYATIQNFDMVDVNLTNYESAGNSSNGTAAVVGSAQFPSTIENVDVKNVVINSNRISAGIAGYFAGTISNCTVENITITAVPNLNSDGEYDNGDKIGGIVAYLNSNSAGDSLITGCKVTNAALKGYRDIGGIAGAGQNDAYFTENVVAGKISLVSDQQTNFYAVKDANVSVLVGRELGAPEISGSVDETAQVEITITDKDGNTTTQELEPVCSIENKSYLSLEDALDAADAGDVVKLNKSLEIDGDVELRDVELDIAGNNITFVNGSFVVYGEVVVDDSVGGGEVNTSVDVLYDVKAGADFTLAGGNHNGNDKRVIDTLFSGYTSGGQKGKVTITDDAVINVYATKSYIRGIYIDKGFDMVISGGSVNTSGTASYTYALDMCAGYSETDSSSLTISGGEITSDCGIYGYAIYANGNVDINVSDVTINTYGERGHCFNICDIPKKIGPSLTINSGEFNTYGDRANIISSSSTYGGGVDITIEDGEFSTEGNFASVVSLASSGESDVVINGGSYNATYVVSAGSANNTITINDGDFEAGKEIIYDTYNSFVSDSTIKGGNFNMDPSEYVADGMVVLPLDNGTYSVHTKTPASEIAVEFEKAVNGLYDIVLVAKDGYINEFVSAQLTFTNNSVLLDGTSEMKYTVSGTEEFDVQLDNQDIIEENASTQDAVQKWSFSANTKTLAKTEEKITIGTITFDGFGTADFAVTGNDNFVKTTLVDTNNEDTYVVGGANNLNLADAVIDGEAVEAPMRDVTINIDFKNDLSGVKAAKYNDMTVTVENAKLGFKEIYKIGKKTTEADQDGVEYIDNYTNELATIETTLFANYQYTVTLEGAGYRTYKYVTTVDEGNDELVLTFWNNAKKENSTVDPFISVEDGGKEIRTTFLAGDISMDNTIDKYDLAAVVSYFGTYDLSENNNPQYAKYDLNRDGKIDAEDIAYVLYSFGY